MVKKIAVLGSGIIGLSIAYKLLKLNDQISLSIFEKEDAIGKHQSGRNSGVLHCGLYYEPGSLKAKLAVDGIREMTDFCKFTTLTMISAEKLWLLQMSGKVSF